MRTVAVNPPCAAVNQRRRGNLHRRMKEPHSSDAPSRETSKARKLKVEATGDFAVGKVKPQIRLKGLWLSDAGFKPGKNVEVSVLKEGLLKLEVHEEASASAANAGGGA